HRTAGRLHRGSHCAGFYFRAGERAMILRICLIAAGLLIAACSNLPAQALLGDTCHAKDAVSLIPKLVSTGQWQELETAGRQLVERCPDSDFGYHWLGVSYLRQGRTFAAVRTF